MNHCEKKEKKKQAKIFPSSLTPPTPPPLPPLLARTPTYRPARCAQQALHRATVSPSYRLVAMGTVGRGGKAQAAQDSLRRKDGRQQ